MATGIERIKELHSAGWYRCEDEPSANAIDELLERVAELEEKLESTEQCLSVDIDEQTQRADAAEAKVADLEAGIFLMDRELKERRKADPPDRPSTETKEKDGER